MLTYHLRVPVEVKRSHGPLLAYYRSSCMHIVTSATDAAYKNVFTHGRQGKSKRFTQNKEPGPSEEPTMFRRCRVAEVPKHASGLVPYPHLGNAFHGGL